MPAPAIRPFAPRLRARLRGGFLAASVLCTGVAHSSGALPDGEELMRLVRRQLPAEPVEMEWRLTGRSADGRVERVWLVEAEARWHGDAPRARYVLTDRFGDRRREVSVSWDEGGRACFRFFEGDPPVERPDADPHRVIEDLDLTWSDLSFAFLWWEGAKTLRTERFRGRTCYVVRLPAPEEERAAAYLDVWVDREAGMVTQAEVFDRDGRRTRKLKVKSVKKMGDRWILKDLDIFSYPSLHKTTLRVERLHGSPEGHSDDSQT